MMRYGTESLTLCEVSSGWRDLLHGDHPHWLLLFRLQIRRDRQQRGRWSEADDDNQRFGSVDHKQDSVWLKDEDETATLETVRKHKRCQPSSCKEAVVWGQWISFVHSRHKSITYLGYEARN